MEQNKTIVTNQPRATIRWKDSGLTHRYGELGSAAVTAALLFTNKRAKAKLIRH